MNREAIEMRIAALEKEVFNGFDTVKQRNALSHIAVFLRDLALEVSELHPEELTLEDQRVYMEEKEQVNKMLLAKDERNDERDKLAQALVEEISNNTGMYPPRILALAGQLKVKLDASKK